VIRTLRLSRLSWRDRQPVLTSSSAEITARASQARAEFADASRIIVNRKQNAATEAAVLIMLAVGSNKMRHETLQKFIFGNDSSPD
jgi:mRNA degradation ribonuclease J1/J2